MKIKFFAYIIVIFVSAVLPSAAYAQSLTDSDIQKLFEGNTVAGRYFDDGQPFSEFHHSDGHAYGYNRGVPNTDACWIVQPGKVCYYYGPPERRLLFCFNVIQSGDSYILENAAPNTNKGRINAFAKVEKGNPEKLGDGGKPWTCDGLVSGLPNASRKVVGIK